MVWVVPLSVTKFTPDTRFPESTTLKHSELDKEPKGFPS